MLTLSYNDLFSVYPINYTPTIKSVNNVQRELFAIPIDKNMISNYLKSVPHYVHFVRFIQVVINSVYKFVLLNLSYIRQGDIP